MEERSSGYSLHFYYKSDLNSDFKAIVFTFRTKMTRKEKFGLSSSLFAQNNYNRQNVKDIATLHFPQKKTKIDKNVKLWFSLFLEKMTKNRRVVKAIAFNFPSKLTKMDKTLRL